MKHYTKSELDMYRHGEISVLGRVACAAHLKACPKCAALFKELKDDDLLVRDLRASVRIFQELSPNQESTEKV